MSSKVIAGLCLAFALGASTGVLAFQEQKDGQAAPDQANQPAAGVSDAQSGAAKEPDGTEVRIPGFGKLGVLPKMDFGLELLYGAADQKQPEPAPSGPAQSPDQDDLSIRGTMKHKF